MIKNRKLERQQSSNEIDLILFIKLKLVLLIKGGLNYTFYGEYFSYPTFVEFNVKRSHLWVTISSLNIKKSVCSLDKIIFHSAIVLKNTFFFFLNQVGIYIIGGLSSIQHKKIRFIYL